MYRVRTVSHLLLFLPPHRYIILPVSIDDINEENRDKKYISYKISEMDFETI